MPIWACKVNSKDNVDLLPTPKIINKIWFLNNLKTLQDKFTSIMAFILNSESVRNWFFQIFDLKFAFANFAMISIAKEIPTSADNLTIWITFSKFVIINLKMLPVGVKWVNLLCLKYF